MAIIQTIREKYAKVAGGVIVLALIGFVLMDFGKSGYSGSTTAAKVNGEKIDYMDFQNEINRREELNRAQNPNYSPDEFESAQMREEVWSQMVTQKVMTTIFDKLGISVSEREVQEMFNGPVPNKTVVEFIQNQLGSYDPIKAEQIYNDLERTTNPDQKKFWQEFKEQLIATRREEKISAMVAGSVYTPKAILDIQHQLKHTTVSANLVQIPYTVIGEDKVKATDEEIKQFMSEHKSLFENKIDFRGIDYVIIPIAASQSDSNLINNELDSLKAAFIASDDPITFSGIYSSQPTQPIPAKLENLQQFENDTDLINAPIGSVVGPFNMGELVILAKAIESKPDSGSISVRHILIMTKQGEQLVRDDASAQRLADSLASALNSGADFGQLAAQYSEDPGSKDNGGKYVFGPQDRQNLTKEFGDFAYTGKVGEKRVVKVESQGYSGYHIMEILPNASEKQLIFLTKEYTPSETTKQQLNTLATEFATKASKGGNAFDKNAQAMGLLKQSFDRINPNTGLMGNIGASENLVNWAAKATVGDISPIFIVNNNYMIAKLTHIYNKGEFNNSPDARNYAAEEVKKRKRAKLIQEANKGQVDIQALATKYNQTISTIDSITFFNPRSPLINAEPKVHGYMFSETLKPGSVSSGIAGMQGVYYVLLISRNDNSQGVQRDVLMEEKLASSMSKVNAAKLFLNSLMESAEIEDNRAKFMQRTQ